jgi:hypothetical protein
MEMIQRSSPESSQRGEQEGQVTFCTFSVLQPGRRPPVGYCKFCMVLEVLGESRLGIEFGGCRSQFFPVALAREYRAVFGYRRFEHQRPAGKSVPEGL